MNGNNCEYTWFKPNQIRIPIRSFTDECGIARSLNPSFSTMPSYRAGGNIGTKYLIKGAKLYLLIECKGALFSIDDRHAAQGNEEVCGTAIETSIFISVRLTVRCGDEFKHIKSPCLLTQLDARHLIQYYSMLGITDKMLETIQKAVRQMIVYLE